MKWFVLLLALMQPGCEMSCSSGMSDKQEETEQYKSGVRACKAGVPASANPEVFDSKRRAWLEGWMSERQRGETR